MVMSLRNVGVTVRGQLLEENTHETTCIEKSFISGTEAILSQQFKSNSSTYGNFSSSLKIYLHVMSSSRYKPESIWRD